MIAERGIAATRIVDVAERAGTSAAAVLYWFPSKDELLAEALTVDEERFNEELNVRLAGLRDAPARLLAMLEACVFEYDWTLWIEVWTRALRDQQVRDARLRLDERWREMLSRVIRDGAASGEFAPENADEAALTLASLIDGLAVQVTLRDPVINPGHMHEIAIDAADRLLGTDLRAAATAGSPAEAVR